MAPLIANETVFIAGHRGMVGQALMRKFTKLRPLTHLLTADRSALDLTNQQSVFDFFQKHKPDRVIIAAAKVGGIIANRDLPADFLYQNLMIEANVIHGAWQAGIAKIVFLGSSCIYPKFTNQPIQEADLLTGLLEETNEPYAIAKIAGIKLCESYNRQHGTDFRTVMPTNLFGLGDNYHPEHSHVIPGLINRFYQAKQAQLPEVAVWGSGQVEREFMFADDLADAVLSLMELPKDHPIITRNKPINVGSGMVLSIKDLALKIAETTGFEGAIVFDTDKPDGVKSKTLDSTLLASTGWQPKISLSEGLHLAFQDYLSKSHPA